MINLCFHGIGRPRRQLEPGEDRYWISEDLYARVLDEIEERSDVQLSFDDGNASDMQIGLAGLQDHQRTATFFVIAGRIDQPGSLSSDEVVELKTQGMRIGSHGMHHVPWRSLSEEAIQCEFVEARERIQELVGSAVHEAALPLGQYDRRTLSSLRELGYRRVYSSDRQPTDAGAWFQPRFSVCTDDTIDSIRASILTPWTRSQLLKGRGKTLIKRLR